MKALVPLAALALLAACATAPQPTSSAPISAGETIAPGAHVMALLHGAGRADAPSQTEVERILGAPDILRQDGAGAVLTYRYDQCALLLLFTADARNEMRLAEAHPGPRRSGADAPSLAQCSAEASARGS
jgi:hypothetical protein